LRSVKKWHFGGGRWGLTRGSNQWMVKPKTIKKEQGAQEARRCPGDEKKKDSGFGKEKKGQT